ncbi:diguanylate cyclase (GGDEF)-like protein [Silvibacterium bohemicum]|uniref:diguanylate cyclase n=1 Tax=Silvibacterium bohemicum TaxID=1577686 RepID=A0A841JL72_9BACT|nr:diguanylate cyclase [Silvibacterium bohemicum]MBB6142096.1 diguanylate cyclase (GGDEF)-like protein [Silvibacterium bohemicum]
MPIALSNTLPGKNRAVQLLILAALGACICVAAAGWLHYSAAKKLNESRDWIEHSQTVMSSLRSESQVADRIDTATRLFQLTKDEENIRSAQTSQVSFNSGALRLQDLTSDNPRQNGQARKLVVCADSLGKAIGRLKEQGDAVTNPLSQCRLILGTLQEVERELLSQRTDESKLNSQRSIILSVSFTVLSILVILALFGFLLRDAVRRKQYERRLYEANEKLASTVRALERQAKESTLLTSVRDELQLCVRLAQAQECAIRYFEQLLPGTSGSICLTNNTRHMVEEVASWGSSTLVMDAFTLEGCCGLRSGRMRWRRPMQSEVHCTHFNGHVPEYYVCIPLAAYGDTLGVVYIECLSPGVAAMVDANMAPIEQIVELASISFAGLNLRSRLEQQSIRDGLTGLFNRHYMEMALDRELRRGARHNKPVAVMMMDIDHFKRFNDTYGHEAGDTVLRELAENFLQAVRNEDILCRFGGEEFVAILPELDLEAAMQRAEGLRTMVSEMRIYNRGECLPEVTTSIGVAIYPQHAETVEEILRSADRALYEAKHLGRNRVVPAESVLLA